MFFVIKSSTPQADLAIYRARHNAQFKLALVSLGPTELLISRYLQENYNMSIKAACTSILQNARFIVNLQQEIIVTIPDPKLNTIARIITYGTGVLQGSRILRKILTI